MNVEIRADNEVVITGYVNAVERKSDVLPKLKSANAPGDFVEIIKSGTFAKSLKRRPNVKLELDHSKVIGGTDTNLELREDNIGLHARATITDEETVNAAKNGKLTGWSFGMTRVKSDWDKPEGEKVYTRTISDMDMVEVSILTKRPAYPATSIEVRDGESVDYEVRVKDDDDNKISDDEYKKNKALIDLRKHEIEIIKERKNDYA